MCGAEFQTARELGEQLLSLAQGSKTRLSSWRPIVCWGTTLFCAGGVWPGPRAPEQGLPCMIPSSIAPYAFLYGEDPGVLPLLCGLGPVDLGYPDQALKRSHEALTLAQELSHPFSLACPVFAALSISSAGRGASPRVGRGHNHPLERAGICVLVGAGDYPAGLGAGRAGPERGRDCPDAPGPGRLQAIGAG